MVWRVHVCTIKILKWTRILIVKKISYIYYQIQFVCMYSTCTIEISNELELKSLIEDLFFCFPFSAYGYGTLANLLCCLCSLAGAFIIPFAKRHKTAYNVVLSVFMGLAVGALASDAILHLVPEVSSGPPSFVLLSFQVNQYHLS